MQISKILNNNAAVVRDEQGQEKIVMGKGICFQKKAGAAIDPAVIDKTFFLSADEANHKFQVLVKDIPMEHIVIGEEIIAQAKKALGKDLNDMVYISLIDHVHTSIIRFLDGITVKNVLLWDIRRFYREEFAVGLWALALMKQRLKVELPEDEAHLKFFAKRLIEQNNFEDDDNDDLFEIVRQKYTESYHCVERITTFLTKKYGHPMSKEEQLYLTIHIERAIHKTQS